MSETELQGKHQNQLTLEQLSYYFSTMFRSFHPLFAQLNVRIWRREERWRRLNELIKHLFNGFHLLTKTRLARTTGCSRMNLGDKSARVYLGLTLGLRADKRPAWKQLWLRLQKKKKKESCLEFSWASRENGRFHLQNVSFGWDKEAACHSGGQSSSEIHSRCARRLRTKRND